MFRLMVCLLAFGLVLGSELANKERERMLLRSLIEVLDRRAISEDDKTRLREMYDAVCSDVTDDTWCTAKYIGKAIVPGDCGSSYDDFLSLLKDDIRLYAYVRYETGEEFSRKKRFAFITWIGPTVPPLKKAKVSTDKAFVKKIWEKFAKEILADELAELKKSKIERTLENAGSQPYGTGH